MTAIDPTRYLIEWLVDPGADHLRNELVCRSRLALTATSATREQYLRELMFLVGFIWHHRPPEAATDHTRKLWADLTHEQIEAADWLAIASALTI